MKNVAKVALLASTVAVSSTAFAGQPVGAAMISSKVVHQTPATSVKVTDDQVATTQIKSFQWGSTPARTSETTERVVESKSFEAKPSVITWPNSSGTIRNRGNGKR